MTPRDFHRLVRAAWIAAFIMGGIGLLIYGLVWLLAVTPLWLLGTIFVVLTLAFLAAKWVICDTGE